ncbi:MAG: hypothetical protein E6J91_50590 [Deltaproteobacteria bacterium]|nr:MAG: hypothetical protein E6J91_50590 [Deltaproteobacteria bacterium]
MSSPGMPPGRSRTVRHGPDTEEVSAPADPGENRHAWLQKHPSPLTAGGEFHWYPERSPDRELRAGFVERVRGIEPPAVLWQIERGRVAWGQVFSATAPLDGRRYVGLVLSVVEDDRPVGDLLAALAPPPAAPWSDGLATESHGRELAVQELAAVRREAWGDVAGVVRALLSGGPARIDDPESPRLPAWIASIERTLPELGGKPRCGVLCTSGPAAASGARDRVAELAAAAWREPASRQAGAWTLLCELAAARGESLDQAGAALDAIDAGAVLTAEERTLVAGGGVVDVLHAWGRGRLDRSPDADTLVVRLADLVAARALAQLAAGEDAAGAIAEARWHALVPAARRAALLTAVAQRAATLRKIVEAHHG